MTGHVCLAYAQLWTRQRLVAALRVCHCISFLRKIVVVLYDYTIIVEFIMADKEATVYIVDVGRSMGEKRNGRTESDLDWAMRYVWDRITSTVRDLERSYIIMN